MCQIQAVSLKPNAESSKSLFSEHLSPDGNFQFLSYRMMLGRLTIEKHVLHPWVIFTLFYIVNLLLNSIEKYDWNLVFFIILAALCFLSFA